MYDLLYKELRLAAHPSVFVFLFMGALVLIPAYPYGVVIFFGALGLFQTFMFDRETRDVFYTALLPVRKGTWCGGSCCWRCSSSWCSWSCPCLSPFCGRCTCPRESGGH